VGSGIAHTGGPRVIRGGRRGTCLTGAIVAR